MHGPGWKWPGRPLPPRDEQSERASSRTKSQSLRTERTVSRQYPRKQLPVNLLLLFFRLSIIPHSPRPVPILMSAPFVERTPLSDATPSSQASTHSPPNSPRSIASLPSPPSSPRHRERDVNSIPGSPSSMASDFPLSSLNSSLFLSEVSSPVLHPSLNEDASSKTLIIPSLTLPDTRHNSTAGEAIGNLRLWVMGRRSLGCKSAAESLVIGAPLISEVNEWSTSSDGYSVLRASTMLSLDRDPLHSADRERRCNVEIFVVEYEEHQDVSAYSRVLFIRVLTEYVPSQAPIILDSILSVIHRPFLSIDRLLNDSEPSTTSFIPLLTSSTTHLYTGLVFLLSSCMWPDFLLLSQHSLDRLFQ